MLPFAAHRGNLNTEMIAAAVPDELITELARLRWLFIIARGSSFRFPSFSSDPQEVRNALGVRYCLSGAVEAIDEQIELSIELTDLDNNSVVWSERYAAPGPEVRQLREQIKQGVVSALELEIPFHEANRARLVDPGGLSTWASYHLGLQQLNRFGAADIARACDYFRRAIDLEPGFSRAHSALSAAHFQNAFQRLATDTKRESRLARQHAEESLALDAQDPFAHFVMGRVHWLEADVPASQSWLQRAVELSPNSAKGHYARAWTDSILGKLEAGDEKVTLALTLSPLDPFRYGMLGVRAFNCLWREDFSAAAHWAREAASSPGAHALIAMIAVAALELDGHREEAQRWAQRARERHADVSRDDFFVAFPFDDASLRSIFDRSLRRHDF